MCEGDRSAALDLARKVLAWWEDARYMTTGERGEYNVFNGEPDFVQAARAIVASPDVPAPKEG